MYEDSLIQESSPSTSETVLTERGQISIPAAIRKHFNLKPGMGFIWTVRDDGIFLLPVPEDPIEAFSRGDSKASTAELLKDRNNERERDEKRIKRKK